MMSLLCTSMVMRATNFNLSTSLEGFRTNLVSSTRNKFFSTFTELHVRFLSIFSEV